MIREIMEDDLLELLTLYTKLHQNSMPILSEDLLKDWYEILEDPRHHIIVAVEQGKIVSSCVCLIIPNLTHNQRPYALIENVITDEEYRRKGYARSCLDYAKELAEKSHCYKIMLMTGAKKKGTLDFYKKAGYNCKDKTAFIQWLE